ncbi:MAG TPA: response regulator transcription factor [Leadbetterella sp.]|nr:response regulator transcription factor [Leadbetterella sp.]
MEITILVADDHPLIVKGMADFLLSNGYKVIAAETNGIMAYHKLINLKPQIAILDIEMPDMNGFQIVEKLNTNGHSSTIFIFNTIHKEQSILQRAIEIGVRGYMLKESTLDEILICLQSVIRGGTYFGKNLTNQYNSDHENTITSKLSPSEIKILRLIAQKKNTKEIAEMLFVAEKTIEKHRSNIIRKMGLSQTKNSLLIWSLQNKDELLLNKI